MAHLSYGTTRVTTSRTAGSGNALTTAKATFTNASPDLVTENRCTSSTLTLEATADTSSLASDIQAYSDGYKATVTLGLEFFAGGAQGGWRGVCIVYYSSQYVMDATNGSLCAVAQQTTTAAAGPFDFGGLYTMHVTAATWAPPEESADLTPSDNLSDAKYGRTTTPSATQYIYTEGYYASASWYQPKYASSYTTLARFGRNNYIGAFCM